MRFSLFIESVSNAFRNWALKQLLLAISTARVEDST